MTRKFRLNWMKDRKLFLRFLIFMVSANILIMAVMSVLFHYEYKKSIMKSFGESGEQLMLEVKNSVELVFDNIMRSSIQVYNDRSVKRFMDADASKLGSYDIMQPVKEKLQQLRLSCNYVHSVYLYAQRSGRVFSTAYGLADAEKLPDQAFLAWYEAKTPTIQIMNTHPVRLSRYTEESLDAISVFTLLPISGNESAQGAMVVNIDQKKIYEKILDKLAMDERAPFYILDDSGQIIMSKDSGQLYRNIEELDFYKERTEETSRHFLVTIEGGEYMAITDSLPEYGWQILSFYPLESVHTSTIRMGRFLILFDLAAILICFVMACLFFNENTKDIDQLLTRMNEQISGSGRPVDRGRIYQQVRRTISENADLTKSLNESRGLLKERVLVSLIHGTKSREETDADLEHYEIAMAKTDLLVAIIVLEEFDETLKKQDIKPDLASLSVTNILQKNRFENSQTVYTDISEIVFFIDGSRYKVSEINAGLLEIIRLLHQNLGIRAFAGICDEKTDVYHIRQAYKNAKEAVRSRYFCQGDVVYYSDIRGGDQTQFYYPFELEKYFEQAVCLGDTGEAMRLLDEFMEDVAGRAYARHSGNIKFLLLQFNSFLINTANKLNIPMDQIYSNDNVIKNIFFIRGKEDAKFFFSALLKKMILVYEQTRSDKTSRYYERIMECIRENYRDSAFNMDRLSDSVGISPTYINQILNGRENRPFNQLVNEMRINAAVECLESGEYKIQEIAEMVGFSSSKYFISVFKKIMGVTPGNYQK